MAHELQMALLPQQFPDIPRGASPTESAIEFSSYYYPMEAVSGDFFTVDRLSETAVAVEGDRPEQDVGLGAAGPALYVG